MAQPEVDHGSAFVSVVAGVTSALVESADRLDPLFRVVEGVSAVTGAESGVMVADRNQRLRLLASSTEQVRLLELFEIQHSEGPCPDAFRSGLELLDRPVGPTDVEWPHFSPLAGTQGFVRVSALPLRSGDETIGALNVFLRHDRCLSEGELAMARSLARLATLAIIRDKAEETVNQLQIALDSRVVIEQAKGVLSNMLGVDTHEAFEVLRSYSRHNNRKITDVGRELLEGIVPVELGSD